VRARSCANRRTGRTGKGGSRGAHDLPCLDTIPCNDETAF
jgi:hypothetical protein